MNDHQGKPNSALTSAALVIVILWFLVGGIAHFVATAVELRVVPPWVPWPLAAVMISGAFELLGVAGLLHRKTRSPAGIGLFLLTIAVSPVHVFMLQHPELFGIPYWLLVLRVPLQVVLLVLIARVILDNWQSRA
ncbi:MAG: hypothetical protein ABI616_08080 [Pseudomonadota bacterium]